MTRLQKLPASTAEANAYCLADTIIEKIEAKLAARKAKRLRRQQVTLRQFTWNS